MINESLIQSGRTTRMIEKAKEVAATGKRVIVVAANVEHCEWFKRYRLSDYKGLGISFVPASLMPLHFWITGKFDSLCSGAVFFVDHYAIESMFDFLVKELHAYDK